MCGYNLPFRQYVFNEDMKISEFLNSDLSLTY